MFLCTLLPPTVDQRNSIKQAAEISIASPTCLRVHVRTGAHACHKQKGYQLLKTLLHSATSGQNSTRYL